MKSLYTHDRNEIYQCVCSVISEYITNLWTQRVKDVDYFSEFVYSPKAAWKALRLTTSRLCFGSDFRLMLPSGNLWLVLFREQLAVITRPVPWRMRKMEKSTKLRCCQGSLQLNTVKYTPACLKRWYLLHISDLTVNKTNIFPKWRHSAGCK